MSPSTMPPVIVFGPTGQVGSIAALTASSLGATVWLAMRDTSKSIPGLPQETEQAGRFHRIQADLHNPDSISQAIKTSGAKRAFIYLAFGAQDHMKSAIEALKTAGVQFVVFLSSFTIPTDRRLRDVPAEQAIPYIHAQVEANLEDVFGAENFVAIRAGAFATNLLAEKEGIAKEEVDLYGGGFEQDNVVPADLGRVVGNILVSGPRKGQRKVYVYGPEVRSIQDSIARIGETLGKEVRITAMGEKAAFERYVGSGLPEAHAKYMVKILGTKGPDKGSGERFPNYEEGVGNVELYTGEPATSLEDWVEENKGLFSA